MSNRDKRVALFHRGSEAFARFSRGQHRGKYACPICAVVLPMDAAENGDLTLEDVPPRSLGGKGLVLTCRACNNAAGYRIDAHAKGEDQIRAFAEALSGTRQIEKQRAKIEWLGESLNVEVTRRTGERVVRFEVLDKINRPAAVRRSAAALRTMADEGLGDGETIKLTSSIRSRVRWARISDLKSAYLLGFALWGYSFAFNPRLDAVREQIRNPEQEALPGAFWLQVPGKRVAGPEMVLITDPIRFLLVWLRGFPYILPVPWGPENLYALCAEKLGKPKTQMTGKPLELPHDCPMYLAFRELSD